MRWRWTGTWGSTAAVGAVGPGGTDEGDVIGLTGFDLEVDGNDVEEGGGDVLGAEVVADVEEELVGARGHGGAFEERGVATAGGVGGGVGEEGVVLEELDADTGGGFARGGVEDVGGEFWRHGDRARGGGKTL